MAIDFPIVLILDLVVAVPVIAYYYYWGVSFPEKKGVSSREVLLHVRNAYMLAAFAIVFMPVLLLYYLYTNILYQFPGLFWQTALILAILVLIFEYVNYYSYLHYELGRLRV